MDYNFALMSYSTENIGDEIQSIAARRFLPRVDEYVDRDYLAQWVPEKPTKIILNGWYNRNPQGWPPVQNGNMYPLLTSMHVSIKDEEVRNSFESQESLQFLSANSPVGARDSLTLEFFEEQQLEAYFSGCVTLTLQRDPQIQKQDFILAVDVPKSVVEKMRQETQREVIELTVYHFPYLDRKERFAVAEYILSLYQSAHAIVTTRLHCFLPSLAFETPVLLIKDNEKYEANRYGGLDTLPHCLTEEEYLLHPELFPLDEPLKNPSSYLKIRQEMIERIKGFTGYSNDETFRSLPLEEFPLSLSAIRIFTYTWSTTFKKALLEGDVKWNEERIEDFQRIIRDLKSEQESLFNKKMELELEAESLFNKKIELELERETLFNEKAELLKEVEEMRQSTSWKITEPLRKLKIAFKKFI